jgi:hypothetical protein
MAIRSPIIALASLLLALAGCSKFDLREGIPWTPGADGELERPMKIMTVWTDTVMSHGDATPVRGFGGRLLFYAREDGKPVKVKGSLVVYAFDETNRDPRNIRPDRKYVFSEEEFEKHYSEEKVGHTYSVWLPWDRVGGPQTEISLVARFTPNGGGTIVGEQQTAMLPGTAPIAAMTPHPRNAIQPRVGTNPQFQQASYVAQMPQQVPQHATGAAGQSPTIAAPKEPVRMTTTTIPIPPRAGNRMPSASTAAAAHPLAGQISSSPNQATAQQQPQQAGQPHWQAEQSSTRFGRDRLQPLGAPIVRPSRDHGPWQPSRAARPSAAEAIRQSGPAS